MNKFVNTHILCNLDAWPENPTKNLKFMNWLFEAVYIVKIVIRKNIYIVDTE